MSDLPTHTERWQHHRQPRPTALCATCGDSGEIPTADTAHLPNMGGMPNAGMRFADCPDCAPDFAQTIAEAVEQDGAL